MHHNMELTQEWQKQPKAAATQHPMPDHTTPPVFASSNPVTELDVPGWSAATSDSSR